MLDRGNSRSTGAAVVARDLDHVRAGLRDTTSDRTNTDDTDELDRNPSLGVDCFQVEDQLREIFDGVDVMVRRRRDECHALRSGTDRSDVAIDLLARQLPALARLGTLRDLDLDLRGGRQIRSSNPKPARSHLSDLRLRDVTAHNRFTSKMLPGRVAILAHVVIAYLIFTALSTVGRGTEAVHGHGQRLVRLSAESAER